MVPLWRKYNKRSDDFNCVKYEFLFLFLYNRINNYNFAYLFNLRSHCVIKTDGGTATVATEIRAALNKHDYQYDPNQWALDVDTIYYHPDYVEGQKV